MVLDEHCPCGNGPEAMAAAEKRGPVERNDYESWFWSRGPATGSARDRAVVERLSVEALRAAGEAPRHDLDRRHGGPLPERVRRASAVFSQSLVHPPAQPVRSARAVHAHVRRCGPAGGAGREVGGALRAAEQRPYGHLAREAAGGDDPAVEAGLLRLHQPGGRADRPHSGGPRAARPTGRNADRLHVRPRRHDRRPEPVAQVVCLRAVGAHPDAHAVAGRPAGSEARAGDVAAGGTARHSADISGRGRSSGVAARGRAEPAARW